LTARAARLGKGLAEALTAAGLQVQVPVVGPLVGVFFAAEPVRDFAGAKASADTGNYPGFMHGLLDHGVAVAPGAYEVMFPSLRHTDEDVEKTVQAASGTTRAMAATAR
jgi:glutamate-1-semialdehyde 2,1-aminomutase